MTFLELCLRKAERVWSMVDVRGADECWPWTGPLNGGGYGQIDLSCTDGNGGIVRHAYNAHRVVWTIANRRDPGDQVVRHFKCHWRPCCNPAHLRPGTNARNSRDMIEAGRSLKGDRNPNARLTPAAVLEIRAALARGETQAAIAARFGTTDRNVGHIATGRRWAHVA